VSATVAFQTKPEIALGQIKAARAAGLPEGVVLMDAGYGNDTGGNDTGRRTEIAALGLRCVAGIGPNTSVWPPGIEPLRPQRGRGSGRPPKLLRRDDEHQPVSVKALARGLPAPAWQTITGREGSADWLASRFARQRVRPWAFSPRA
jgi:SRSO17 transposase